nr:hypothetical protein [Burkholderia sp. JKS000303]
MLAFGVNPPDSRSIFLQAHATAAGRTNLGLEVLAVTVSAWDSVNEGPTTSVSVRLAFSLSRGTREDVAGRIERGRAARSFVDVADLPRRARLDRHDRQVLARANALRSLACGNRRAALWLAAAGIRRRSFTD